MGRIICADNLEVLPTLAPGSVDLIYIDPPFNTGTRRAHTRIKTVRDVVVGSLNGRPTSSSNQRVFLEH